MAKIPWQNPPLSGRFCAQRKVDTPCSASKQDIWPFSSPLPFVSTTGLCAQTLLGTLEYSTETKVDVIRICDGSTASFHDCSDDEDLVSEFRPLQERDGRVQYNIFLIKNDLSRRRPISMTQQSLAKLLEHNNVPPEFVEILVNNNGAYTSSVEYGKDQNTPAHMRLFLKYPTSISLNAAIYFHYDFSAKTVRAMVFGTYLAEIESRLLQLFPPGQKVPIPGQDDPFVLISAILAEHSSMMEYKRRELDLSVRDQESKTGVSALVYDESLRAQATEYGDLVRALHVVEGLVMFFGRTLHYQIGLLMFLHREHKRWQTLSRSRGENMERNPMTLRVGDSFGQSLSLTTHRLEQVKTLERRVQIQLGVVQNLISQNDSRVNILVATQSAHIAMDTRKDSIAMKTIAGITMVFLPGTFVATFFSMGFFHIADQDGRTKFSVNSFLWLYVAAAAPLTFTVGLLWYWMLRRNGYDKSREGTMDTLGLEKHPNP